MKERMGTPRQAHRYAIYYVPEEDTGLFAAATLWLGRDARTDSKLEPPLPAKISRSDWERFTEGPRRYGFHATLKPPFRLASGRSPDELRARLRRFASHQQRFTIPGVSVGRITNFLALRSNPVGKDFPELAGKCVTDFDEFRTPPTQEDLDARSHNGLNVRERRNLERWGYPYVLDTWKFHMTLTSSLQPAIGYIFQQHITARLAEHCNQRFSVESICLFEEPEPGSPFLLTDRFPLEIS